MPTQTFQLIGQIGSGGSLSVARLRFRYGGGYEQSVLVGHSSGDESVSLVFNALSDRTAQNLVDAEDSVTRTPLEYAIAFFTRRMVDGAAFNVTTTRGDTLLVYLDEETISYDYISKSVFKGGLRFRQART